MKTKYITHKGPQSTWNIFRHKQWIWLYPLATKTQQMLYSVSELVPAGYHFRMTEMEAHDALKSKLHNVCHTVYAKSSMSLTQMRWTKQWLHHTKLNLPGDSNTVKHKFLLRKILVILHQYFFLICLQGQFQNDRNLWQASKNNQVSTATMHISL